MKKKRTCRHLFTHSCYFHIVLAKVIFIKLYITEVEIVMFQDNVTFVSKFELIKIIPLISIFSIIFALKAKEKYLTLQILNCIGSFAKLN